MELASIFINLGILAATVVAGIIAWRAVVDAHIARDEAVDSERKATAARDAAVAAAERSATAGERSAVALERQVALAENAAEVPTWTPARMKDLAVPSWMFSNTSLGKLAAIEIHLASERSGEWEVDTVADPMASGQWFRIVSNAFTPRQCTVSVTCVDPSGKRLNDEFVIF